MKSCILRANQILQTIAIAGVIGLAAPASVALAQSGQGHDDQGQKSKASASASKPPHSVSGVVVQPAPNLNKVPPARKATLDAQAAKRQAWQNYRSTPVPTSAPGSANPGMSATARAGDFPGLSNLPSR